MNYIVTLVRFFLSTINTFFSAPTQGHLKIRVHDEAYARVHVGILNTNFDFFVARVCFKGGTEYNINILQVSKLNSVVHQGSEVLKIRF